MELTLNNVVKKCCDYYHTGGFAISDDAPNTFEDLKQFVNDHGYYEVYNGGCDHTIYDDPQTNYAFRAWHDYHHVTKNLDFTPLNEMKVVLLQIQDIYNLFGVNDKTIEIANIIYADGIGQVEYFEKYNDFPIDQKAFVNDYLITKKIHKEF